jgi:hypothetical protein
MITDIDPYFSTRSDFSLHSTTRSTSNRHRSLRAGDSRLGQLRAERESAFEQAHGSLWVPGLLDRLTAPLTRYHE